jgi:hypothetical protein
LLANLRQVKHVRASPATDDHYWLFAWHRHCVPA